MTLYKNIHDWRNFKLASHKLHCHSILIHVIKYVCCTNDINISSFRDDSKNHTNDSTTGIDEIPDVEVEFTPNLTWKSKARSKGSDASDHQNLPTRGIATPVIKSLASVLRLETPNTKQTFKDDDTPVREANRSKGSTKVLRR